MIPCEEDAEEKKLRDKYFLILKNNIKKEIIKLFKEVSLYRDIKLCVDYEDTFIFEKTNIHFIFDLAIEIDDSLYFIDIKRNKGCNYLDEVSFYMLKEYSLNKLKKVKGYIEVIENKNSFNQDNLDIFAYKEGEETYIVELLKTFNNSHVHIINLVKNMSDLFSKDKINKSCERCINFYDGSCFF